MISTVRFASTDPSEREIAFEAFGVRALVRTSHPEYLERVVVALPPGWRECAPADVERQFEIYADSAGTYGLMRDGTALYSGFELDFAISLLEGELRVDVAKRAPDKVFIHAGAVAHKGRAILIPGESFSGKTTLVAALVRAGTVYYSDEFALLDENGLVYPYAKRLSLRDHEHRQSEHDVASLGGVEGEEPLPLGAIIVTRYRPDAAWRPRRLSASEGAMRLLTSAIPARERPAEAMRAIARGAEGAIVLESERGEASAIAPSLLAQLDALKV
jgi:hypothetical protein